MDRQTLTALILTALIAVNCFIASAVLAETTGMRVLLVVIGLIAAGGVLLRTVAYYQKEQS